MLTLGYKYAFVLLLLTAAVAAQSEPSPTPIVIELFTSEGCSDCPPADEFLRTLDSMPSLPGTQLIVLEEHVDYWDHDGWRDPFSSHELTVRQSDYAERLHVASPYTPQMVVDGRFQFVGSDRGAAGKALDSARSDAKVAVRITSLKAENGTWRAHVETGAPPGKADLLVAVAAEHAESQVLRGENSGRHLEHVAVVCHLAKIATVERAQAFSKDIEAKSLGQPARLVVFLQERNQGRILGAAVERIDNQSAARQ